MMIWTFVGANKYLLLGYWSNRCGW